MPNLLLKIQRIPGDLPRAMEQIDGDLLVPAETRPLLAHLLLQAVDGIPAGEPERLALVQACQLLGIDRPPVDDGTARNLLTVRPI